MIRKLLLPLVAVALLGGCVTSGYSYRQGSGDYYYGAPSVEYRYYTPYGHGYPYGYYTPYGHGYPYGYYGGSAYGYRYASPYRYRQYYPDPYRHSYYGDPYRQPAPRPRVDPTPDSTRSPWRNLDRVGRRGIGDDSESIQVPTIAPRIEGDANTDRRPRRRPVPVDTGGMMRPHAPSPLPRQPDSSAEPRDSSALGGMMRRAARKSDPTDETTP